MYFEIQINKIGKNNSVLNMFKVEIEGVKHIGTELYRG